MNTPNAARITTLAGWNHFFSAQGQFRLPSQDGAAVEHLDIDLRFIDHDSHDGLALNDVYLPNVVKLTIRDGEFVQECDDRMDCLAEVFNAISPVEVQWLNAYDHPDEQQTMSTVMVHPAITVAGEIWRSRGTLRKLVIQGGFPVPNLTAPTPFVLTPAASPCPSPGPNFASFPGFQTGLPSLSLTKPKPKALVVEKTPREERQRLADYTLKPRFEWAFGSWGVEHVAWSFEGRYSAAAVKTILTRLFDALNTTYPSASHKVFVDPPSLLALSHVPTDLEMEVPEQIKAYIGDVTFIDRDRAFDVTAEGKDRQIRRFKADMLLVSSNPTANKGDDSAIDSADESMSETELTTPPLGLSIHMQLDESALARAVKNKKGLQSNEEQTGVEQTGIDV